MKTYIYKKAAKTMRINANSIMCAYTYFMFGNMCFMHRFVCLTRVDA